MRFQECERLFQQLNLPNNPVCARCDAEIKRPLLPWQIGEEYDCASQKILFIGKPHRGTPGTPLPSGALGARGRAEVLFNEKAWAYWRYTRDIVSNVFGSASLGWKRIAWLNLVKCTSTNSSDQTTRQMIRSCVSELGVIQREINILKPTMIISYTWTMHRDMLRALRLESGDSSVEVTGMNHRVNCGKKRIGWWHRIFSTSWCEELPMLVLSHPERKAKSEYVQMVTDWIQNGCRQQCGV